jgi:uncharacterized protein YndB with AHSA1/START domain
MATTPSKNQQLSMFQTDGLPSSNTKAITVTKTIPAPAEKVFDHWLIPTFVGNWMFGPAIQNETIVKLENEVKPGGRFSYTVLRGSNEVEYSGEYLEINRPNRLIFSWQNSDDPICESKVTIQFLKEHGKTKIKITHKFHPTLVGQSVQIKQQWIARSTALADTLSS